MGALIVVGLIALVVIVFAVQGLKIIRQGETKVIERLGRYHSTLHHMAYSRQTEKGLYKVCGNQNERSYTDTDKDVGRDRPS